MSLASDCVLHRLASIARYTAHGIVLEWEDVLDLATTWKRTAILSPDAIPEPADQWWTWPDSFNWMPGMHPDKHSWWWADPRIYHVSANVLRL